MLGQSLEVKSTVYSPQMRAKGVIMITPKEIMKISKLTDCNDHTGARIELAKVFQRSFDCKRFLDRYKALKEIHLIEGSLNYHLGLYRDSLDKSFFEYIKEEAGEEVFNRIHTAF